MEIKFVRLRGAELLLPILSSPAANLNVVLNRHPDEPPGGPLPCGLALFKQLRVDNKIGSQFEQQLAEWLPEATPYFPSLCPRIAMQWRRPGAFSLAPPAFSV